MSWPEGFNVADRRTLTRGATAGDVEVRYTPEQGSEAIVMGGAVINNDTAARVFEARLDDDTGTIFTLFSTSVAAGGRMVFPTNDTGTSSWGGDMLVLSSAQTLRLKGSSLAAGAAAQFKILTRCKSRGLIITEVNA